MIKKLRKSFIITAMISVLAVLAVIVAAMNIANYLNSDSEADVLLDLLAENGGSFAPVPHEPDISAPSGTDQPPPAPQDGEQPPEKPEGDDVPPPAPLSDDDDDFDDDDDSDDDDDDRDVNDSDDVDDEKISVAAVTTPAATERPQRDFQQDPRRKYDDLKRKELITAETPYETRYFTVSIKDNGTPESIDTGKIAAVSTEDALEMAQRLIAAGKTRGYETNYKYLIKKTDTGRLCIFIDRGRALKSVRDFMIISLLVALGAAAAVFVLIVIFSGIVTKPVAESYEKQKKFITNAGHELKTPLAVINSCTEVIEMEQGESKWTKGITSQTERLATLTGELVALARMDEGSSQLTFESFFLSETVSEILDPFSLMAEQKGLGFTADIKDGIIFKGDKSMIAKLCSILADNAVKYTPEGGTILFTLSAKGRHIILSSENTAENIEKGAHPELFDRFRRGDSSHSSETPGYGIGLSMAQSIVNAHGGRIEALSKDGNSLTITARL
ncbi:MAG: two-component sensor histidine kinase [Ruminiclostridium sp.]|nr:two-component sensor histidine kinase [Ruminiclostridium sp.]